MKIKQWLMRSFLLLPSIAEVFAALTERHQPWRACHYEQIEE
jgi:hypothetical protein